MVKFDLINGVRSSFSISGGTNSRLHELTVKAPIHRMSKKNLKNVGFMKFKTLIWAL
jgi:hypothetical protein